MRLLDGVVVVFALWTVCCHAVVALGGSLHALLGVFGAVLALAGVARWRIVRRRAPAAPAVEASSDGPQRSRARRIARLVGAAVGVACLITSLRLASEIWLWWSGVLLLAAAAVPFVLLDRPRESAPLAGRGPELALWVVGLVCIAVTLAVHRPDLDDAFYINVAVAAADDPGRALLSGDTMLGIPSLPLHMPAHRVHTYELWNGAISYVSGLPAVYVFHFVSACLAALLVPLAHARLFRLLTPRVWPAAVVALITVLIAVGETHRWYGNFAFVRMWQGKGIFLFVLLPLVYSYALRFALRPTAGRWGLLTAAQIASVGCTSSAIWAAPAAALAATAAGLRLSRAAPRTLALAFLSSLYVLGVGLTLKGEMQGIVASQLQTADVEDLFSSALHTVLDYGNLVGFGTGSILIGWACAPGALGRRFAIVVPLAMLLVLLNPYTAAWVSANVTGPSYWRAMWSMPLPILIALVLCWPLGLSRRRGWRVGGALGTAAMLLLFATFVPRSSIFSERNQGPGRVGLRIGAPGLKVPAAEYAWARELNQAVPPGAIVLAPAEVSVWITTLHQHAHPLQPRRIYLTRHTANLGAEYVMERRRMTLYVAGGDVWPRTAHAFEVGLELFQVMGVMLRPSAKTAEARRVLERSGFAQIVKRNDGEIWVRKAVLGAARAARDTPLR